jgi:hypothetical protein
MENPPGILNNTGWILLKTRAVFIISAVSIRLSRFSIWKMGKSCTIFTT